MSQFRFAGLRVMLSCLLLGLAFSEANAAPAVSKAFPAPIQARASLSPGVASIRPTVAATMRPLSVSDQALPLNFSVALKMRNFDELQARVARGETFSRTELESRYLPLPADYEAVKAWAASEGLAVDQEDSSRLSVFVRGTLAQVQSSLQVSMVKVTADGVDYPAANSAPSLPAAIAVPVLGVNGLHPYHHLHKHARIRPQATTGVTYTVPNILTTYDGLNLGVTGAGQTIAILIDSTPLSTDLTKFWTNNNVSQSLSNVTTVNVNNKDITSVSGEETLDVEWSSGMAPGAKIRVYATGDLEDASLDRGLARIIADLANDSTIHQLSISLGLGETYESNASQFTTDGQYFAALASQGVSTFVSSGDGGSTPDDTGSGDEDAGPLQVEYYSSDPSVTAVGGTTLNVNSAHARTSEPAWSGSGGGVSIQFAKPSWQVGTGVPTGTKRYVPDVAMPADPNTGAYVYLQGSVQTIGGTSWSAPTWAGICALINHARANAGKTGGIGLLNPSIYPLIGTQSGVTNFYDVTTGSNAEGTNAGGKYAATAGYDPVTGIGTPDIKILLNTLVNSTTAVTPPTITSISPTSGPVGTTVTVTGTNFTNAETLAFYSQPDADGAAAFTINSATQITTKVPPAAENGPVAVSIPGAFANGPSFTVTPTSSTPTITNFTPTSGTAGYYSSSSATSATKGTTVTITGTNFTGATKVTFNGVSGEDYSTPFTVNSAGTSITAYVPVDATTGLIKVTTANGKAVSTGTFTVNARSGSPTIASFSPTSGPVGTSVTITGTALSAVTSVSFGSVAATSFTKASTQIVATVPAGAVTGAIGVANTTGGTVSSGTFTVTTSSGSNVPTITSFTPTSGPVGTSVTITGTNFTGLTGVSFNGTTATTFSLNSATQITATVPTGATSGTISATTSNGTATSAVAFTVTTSSSGGGSSLTHLVISQVYGGGGTSTATYANDYVELFNPTNSAISVTGYSVQYASSTGTSWQITKLSGSIAAGHYFLVAEGSGTTGSALPTPDVTGSIAMSATAGKVALANVQTAITGSSGAGVVDFVGYGSANDSEGGSPAPAPSATTADLRANGGYTDTDNNAADFTAGAPNPRNSASPANPGTTSAPDLTVALNHSGSFTQADTGDTYTITVTNSGNAATSGTVSVTDSLPSGLTATAISGTGWTVSLDPLTATRSDALAAGGSYPAITVTVNVASNAPASVTNSVTVSGGETNTANDTASDPTAITALTPSQSWRYQYFGTTANTGAAADSANPSGDGLPNLLKYALGLNPLTPTANPATVDISTGYLRLTVPRSSSATDVTLAIQVTGTLTDANSWTTAGTMPDQNTSAIYQAHDTTPVSSGQPRFLRLLVTRP